MYSIYKQKQSAYGKNAVNNVSIDKAYDDIKKHLTTASSDIDKKIKLLPKGADPSKAPNPNRTWYNSLWTTPTNDLQSDKDNLDKTLTEMESIRNIGKKSNAGGIPAAGGQTSSQTLMQAVQAAQKHPDKIDLIKSRLQGAGIDPSMLDQAIKSQQTQRRSSPQASNMIPAANQTSDNVETEEEE
jgi:hypothetical protein